MSRPSSELKNKVLRAGAGAGKTTTLVSEFLDFTKQFLAEHKKLPRVVVTTFTRKATQELKERLLKKALEDQREDLFHFISSKSSVQISTIHGVLNLYLSRYGSSIGLTPDYKILSESEVRKSARKIIRKIILDKPQLQEMLEEYDFATLEDYLLKYYTEAQIHPQLRFAGQEYFEQRTQEYLLNLRSSSQRIGREIISQTDKEGWLTYIHGLLAIDWKNAESIRSFYDFAKKPSYLKKNPPFSELLNEELENFRDQLDVFIEKPCFTEAYWLKHQKNCESFEELAREFCAEFLRQKLELGMLSMSDLETVAIKLVHEYPETATTFSQEWDFWMIDEYQDTSPIQVELMKALVGDRPSFIVGDPQQSIYLFRGARSKVFFDKMEEVKVQGGELQEKMVNYRSNPEVLQFINHYFTRLDSQFSAMEVDPQKVSESGNQDLQIIITREAESDEVYQEELASVARIQELIKQGVSPEKICLLSRTHKVLEETARIAHAYGVPVQLHSASGFFQRREVQDALNLLKFLVNPHDNYIFLALLRSPWFHLGDEKIIPFCIGNSFWREAHKKSRAETHVHPIVVLKKYLDLSESLGLAWTLKRAMADLGYLDYSCQLDPSGRREANLWKIISIISQEERRPGFNFLDFIESGIETLSTDQGGEDSDATPVIEPKRVNLMTVHASKGLQFDHIILPALGKNTDTRKDAEFYLDEDTNLWTLPVREDDSQKMVQSLLAEKIHAKMLEWEQQEFNRVLYVALTRAKRGISMLIGAKPGKKSWAAGCHLDLEEGLHEEEGFQYIVRKQNLVPLKQVDKVLDLSQVRKVYRDLNLKSAGVAWNVSVTDLISSHVARVVAGSSEPLLPALKRAQQGTEAHKVFESLKYTDFETVRSQASEELKLALDYIAEVREVPLLSIIKNGFVEWGFACQLHQALLQGQIDLWGIEGDTAWILDYKTGSQRYAETAFAQMQVYAWALMKTQQLGDIKRVKLVVIYPLDKKSEVRELSLTDLDKNLQRLFKHYLTVTERTLG